MIAMNEQRYMQMRETFLTQPTTIVDDSGCQSESQSEDLTAAQALLSLMPQSRALGCSFPSVGVTGIQHNMPPVSHVPSRACNSPSPGVVSSGESMSDDSHVTEWSDHQSEKYVSGSTSLALDTDEEYLSPLHCFERRYCVEVFAASEEDVSQPRYFKTQGARVVEGQVGVRCLHCKHRPYSQRGERAVCFPSSLKNIYHSIETWQRRHSLVCPDLPKWVKKSMIDLAQNSKSGAGGRRKYWEDSAKRIGLADTPDGIRFVSTPGDSGSVSDDISETTCDENAPPSFPVVGEGDKELVSSYLHLLLEQMETCQFTEEDRAGGRSKVKDCPVGFAGMQCKHCAGKAGFGRYFPTTVTALSSANSDRNIFNHVSKCRRCPHSVKDELAALRSRQQEQKNKRGSRKLFFQRVWDRIQCEEL
jgi:hypothetical protein